MRTKKTKKPIKETLVTMGIGACLATLLIIGGQLFLQTYELRSPIVFQTPVVKRTVISPLPSPSVEVSPMPQISPTTAVTPKKPIPTKVTPKKQAAITIGPKSYIIDKIKAVFGKDGDVAVQVAMAESNLRYNAQNSCCSGLFQIHRVHAKKYEGKDIMDVDTNIEVAHEIFLASGWAPWEVCTKHVVNCGI